MTNKKESLYSYGGLTGSCYVARFSKRGDVVGWTRLSELKARPTPEMQNAFWLGADPGNADDATVIKFYGGRKK